ncbi:leukocyte receptor cluster member 8-like [Pollicipes pollicipes]|uniref:leukocyte receptor cluster member 8-like n=1 Tax=Pollicipes pollicipes TaxID=41117 RepID=UPI001885566A|nr:leukocyte receptor cluster member 8-like [Pollicipes pollicipes]
MLAGVTAGQSAASAANASSDWPDSLKRYVTRSFERAVTDVEKNRVQSVLREKITAAAAVGPLALRDWDAEPLPNLAGSLADRTAPAGAGHSPMRGRGRPRPASQSAGRYFRGRSRSRSRSRSPPERGGYGRTGRGARRRRNSSSGSSRDDEHRTTPRKNKNSRLEKKRGRKDGKAHFYSLNGSAGGATISTSEQLQKRASRFAGDRGSSRPRPRLQLQSVLQSSVTAGEDGEELDWSSLHIVGTCQDLEKRFLRLTAAPEASSVRPPDVLRRSLELVKAKWKKTQDYHNACDQLKSIRQDLTVQGIRDQFTVHVYETHARIALEKKDHTEFNQCQTQLKALYREVGGVNRLEFTAYRLLYFIFTKAITDITTTLATLTDEDKRDESVKHALQVRTAWSHGNFVRFFRLYQVAPKMSGFLMDWFVERERKEALRKVIKTYRPGVDVAFVCGALACTRPQFEALAAPAGLVFSDVGRAQLDCKASMACLAAL